MDATSFFIACTAGHTADDHMVATERPGRICGRTTCVQHGAKLFLLLGVELNCLQPLRPWGACRAEAYLGRSRNMARPNSAKVWVVSEPDRGAWLLAMLSRSWRTTGSIRTTTRQPKGPASMAKQMHAEAADHHEKAAKAHHVAAEHHAKGDHEIAGKHSLAAHEASVAAHKASASAHEKSTAKPAHAKA